MIVERHGLHDPRWDEIVVRPGRGLGGRVIEECRPVAVSDYLHDSSITGDYRPIVQAESLQSIVCVPVQVNRRVEALLYVAPRADESPGAKAIEQALRIAGMAATCLLHARARSLLAQQARRALRLGDPEALRAVVQQAGDFPHDSDHDCRLTRRQLQVLDLLAVGASNAELALRLGIAEATAKEHVRDVCRKLGATSRLQAVARARETGLV